MRHLTRRDTLAVVAALALLLAAVCSVAAEVPKQPGENARMPRSITYFANFAQDASFISNLAMLVECSKKGYLTHVVVGLFHCAWVDWTLPRGETVSLNGTYLNDPRLMPLWDAIKVMQAHGVKVIASVGGGPYVGDYGHLLDPRQPLWYPELRRALQEHGFDGFDLDIEEDKDVVTTENVRTFLEQLRSDFGTGFILTSAPVGEALMYQASSVSPGIDYAELLRDGSFDWYHVQFYNSWGDLACNESSPDCTHADGYWGAPNYDDLVKAFPGLASKLVAGVPTAESAGKDPYYTLDKLQPLVTRLAEKFPDFGGVYGWTFTAAEVDGRSNPVGWAAGVSRMLHPPVPVQAGEPVSTMRPVAVSSPRYTYRDLGTLSKSGGHSLALAIAPDGTVVGWSETEKKGGQAFTWRPAEGLQQLGESADWRGSQASAVNRLGHVAGFATTQDQTQIPFLLSLSDPEEGNPLVAYTLGGNQAEAWALNDAGDVVGWALTSSAVPRAVAMTASTAMVDLGTLGGPASLATGVNAASHIVGSAQTFGGSWHAFAMTPGEPMKDRHPDPAAWSSQATAVNDAGQIVGWSLSPDGFGGFHWEGSIAAQQLTAPTQGQLVPLSVNSGGQIVGFVLTQDGTVHAFLKNPSSDLLDLNALVADLPAGVTLAMATAINDSGLIVGQTSGGHAFLLSSRPTARRHVLR